MASQHPSEQYPELIQSDEILNNKDYPPYPPELVSKWRIGAQLRHAMETESAQIGHKQGAIEFIRLLKEFQFEDMDNVNMRDIDIILEIMCTFDRSDLLKTLIEHPYLSDFLRSQQDKIYNNNTFPLVDNEDDIKHEISATTKTSKPLQGTLKKAIRTGKIKMLNYLITQNLITINLFDDECIQSKQYQSDLKSLIFNILRAIAIGTKKSSNSQSNCFLCAQQFWTYLSMKLYQKKENNGGDNEALKELINSRDNDDESAADKNVIVCSLKAMNENYFVVKYMSLFMNTMFSKQTTYQFTTYQSKMSDDKLKTILAVLQFQRERYITFENCERRAWHNLCFSLIVNYLESDRKGKKDCLELEMIDYLISGGVPSTYSTSFDDKCLKNALQCGSNNWKMKNWTHEEMVSIIPSIFPVEIAVIIINFICLDMKNCKQRQEVDAPQMI